MDGLSRMISKVTLAGAYKGFVLMAWLGKLTENKGRLIRVKVSSTDLKHNILSKTSSLKGTGIFINEDLIPEDQAELRKEVQKVIEARKEGKCEIIRNRKAGVRDRNQKDSNK